MLQQDLGSPTPSHSESIGRVSPTNNSKRSSAWRNLKAAIKEQPESE
jgi:hypothetical protein